MNPLYTLIVFISSFSLLILIGGISSNRFLPRLKKLHFQALLGTLIAVNWLEWLGVLLNDASVTLRGIHIAVKFAELSLTPCLSIIAMNIFSKTKDKAWIYIPAAFNILLQICSLFTGWVFYVNSDNIYVRGPLYTLYVLTFFVSSVFLVIFCGNFNKKYQHRSRMFLIMISVLVLFSMALPFITPELRMDWTCISFAVILFYIYYNQLEQQLDPLTELLNRKSYDYSIKNIKKETAVIFFDIDRFKYINDTYGHSFGDQCLVLVSKEIKNTFGKSGYCYRFGGDELCVIIKKNIKNIDKLVSGFFENIKNIQITDSKMPSVSVGYAYFNLEKESAAETVKRADEMMYKYKNNHK